MGDMKKFLLVFILMVLALGNLTYGAEKDDFWGFVLREPKAQAIQKAKNYEMTLDYSTKGRLQSYMFINGDFLKNASGLTEATVILYFHEDILIDTYFNFTFKSESTSKDFFEKIKKGFGNKYGIVLENKKNAFVIKQKGLVISSLYRKDSDDKSSVLFSASDNNLIKNAKTQIKKEQQEEK
jgi:hypothetical protein